MHRQKKAIIGSSAPRYSRPMKMKKPNGFQTEKKTGTERMQNPSGFSIRPVVESGSG
jgi:hypothetical protein